MRNVFKKIDKFFWDWLRKLVRYDYLKNITNNIGKVVIEKDEIICYVDQKKLDKYKGNKTLYELRLKGTNRYGYEDFVKKMRLDKPVHYVFDNINFKTGLKTYSFCGATRATFKNCIFNKNVVLNCAEDITFENNKYIDSCDVYYSGNCFLTAKYVKKITFINDIFANSYDVSEFTKVNFGMKIDADLVQFINTNIDYDSNLVQEIKAKKTEINNSKLSAAEIYIDSDSIQTTGDCLIKAKKGVIIENSNYDFDSNIDSPVIIYNGDDVSLIREKDNINIEASELVQSRQNVVNVLNNLKEYCLMLNNNVSVNETINKGNVLVKK